MKRFPLSKQAFAEWLTQREKDGCGWTQSFDDCPLSRCLVDQGEYVPGAIRASHAVLYRPGDRTKYEFTMPPWAEAFVWALDAGDERVVSAKEALEILGMSPVAACNRESRNRRPADTDVQQVNRHADGYGARAAHAPTPGIE